ncbi:MAG: hypothetical protein ABEH83_05650 [Halobacterium sp.]
MPSKLRQLYYLGLRALAWFLWLPLTGDLRHDRTWGELKRLTPRETAFMLTPLLCYSAFAVWAYSFFPRDLVPLATSVLGMGLALGGTLIMTSVVLTKVLELELLLR